MKPRDPIHLVVAEDDEGEWFLFEDILAEAANVGSVLRVGDGQALLDWLRNPANPRPDLVLLDLRMPVMDGFDALAAIRADPSLRGLTVLVFSTSSDRVDVRRAYALGATSYLVKPRRLDELKRRLQAVADYWVEVMPPE